MQNFTKPPKKNCLPAVLKYQQRKQLRFRYRLFLFLCLCFGFTALQEGLASTFVSKASGDWGNSNSWTKTVSNNSNSSPAQGDIVTIQAAHHITLTSTAFCSSLTIQSHSSGNNETTLFLNGHTLSLGNITIISSNGMKKVRLDLGSGTLKVSGSIAFPISEQKNFRITYTTGAIEFYDLTTPSNLTLSATDIMLPSLIFNKAQTALGTDITASGNIEIRSGSLNNAAFNFTGASGKTFEVKNGASFIMTGAAAFPAGFTTYTLNPGSTVEYAGGNQTIAPLQYSNLKISGTGIRTLVSSITLDKDMTLNNGAIALNGSIIQGNYDLTIQPGASITNPTATNYIKQTGTGKLIMEDLAGGSNTEVIFPVGTANSYTPAYIKNVGGSGSYAVHVATGVQGTSGQTVTDLVATRTWDVSRVSGTGSPDITLRLQWDPNTDEGVGFARENVGIAHFTGGTWQQPDPLTFTDGSSSYSATLPNITSFSRFAIVNPNNPLPVELVSFKATPKETGVNLQWITASEKNNQGFQIQHSTNGIQFEDVAFVASKNPNSSTLQHYEFLDKTTTQNGLRYYRLKQTDFDGMVSFSAIKVVEFDKHLPTVYPNPFQKAFSLNLTASAPEELRYQITDLTGKTVYQNAQKLTQGSNTLQIQLPENNPAGFYLLHTQTGGRTTSTRLIKQ